MVSTPDDQRAFVQALGGFEHLAITRAHASWPQLTAEQQHELLTFASTEKSGRSSTPTGRVTSRDHFEQLKGWIVGAYYSSELGMRELGWTEGVFHPALGGCEHRDGH
jgi:hypothetical protein